MNEEINTISEEQVLHNKLSFEINQELIHLMKRIVELQQENARLKDKIEKAVEHIKNIDKYEETLNDDTRVYMVQDVDVDEIERILKEN